MTKRKKHHPQKLKKRQRPSVKRLKKRRKMLDAALAKQSSGARLDQAEADLIQEHYQNKAEWQKRK